LTWIIVIADLADRTLRWDGCLM